MLKTLKQEKPNSLEAGDKFNLALRILTKFQDKWIVLITVLNGIMKYKVKEQFHGNTLWIINYSSMEITSVWIIMNISSFYWNQTSCKSMLKVGSIGKNTNILKTMNLKWSTWNQKDSNVKMLVVPVVLLSNSSLLEHRNIKSDFSNQKLLLSWNTQKLKILMKKSNLLKLKIRSTSNKKWHGIMKKTCYVVKMLLLMGKLWYGFSLKVLIVILWSSLFLLSKLKWVWMLKCQ